MKNYSDDLPGAIAWLEDQVRDNRHGVFALTVKVHEGGIAVIEKSAVTKTKPPTGAKHSGGRYDDER